MAHHIHKILATVFPEEHRWKMDLFEHWDSLIGNLKGKVKIEKIENDVLTLGVVHPAWAQELYFFSGMLKDKINGVLNEERIRIIRFHTLLDGRVKTTKSRRDI